MPTQSASSRIAASHVDSRIVQFLSRADLLHLRGRRNYNRYMLVVKKFVAADSPERLRWQRESAEETERDAAWKRRHGPVPGGARVLAFSVERSGSGNTGHQSIRVRSTDRRS
jgi:hypothetical protein